MMKQMEPAINVLSIVLTVRDGSINKLGQAFQKLQVNWDIQLIHLVINKSYIFHSVNMDKL